MGDQIQNQVYLFLPWATPQRQINMILKHFFTKGFFITTESNQDNHSDVITNVNA